MRHRPFSIVLLCLAFAAGCSGTSGGGGAPPASTNGAKPDVAATGIVGAAGSSTSGEKAPLAGAAQPQRAPSGPTFKMPSVHFRAPHVSLHAHR